MKKAFTLIELIISMSIIVFLGAYGYQEIKKNKEEKYISQEINKKIFFIKNYILDYQIGYINGLGGFCSEKNNFSKITLEKVLKCTDTQDTYSLNQEDNTSKQEIIFMEDLSNADGISLSLLEINENEIQITININQIENLKTQKKILNKIASLVTKNLSSIISKIDKEDNKVVFNLKIL